MARLHTKRNNHGREQESFLKVARGAVFYVSRGCLSRVRCDGNHRETQDRRLDLRLYRASAYYHTKSRQIYPIACYIVASQTSAVCCERPLAANSYSSMQRSLVASGCSIT